MRHYDRGQTEQGEVFDDCCHMTSALGTLCSESQVITNYKK